MDPGPRWPGRHRAGPPQRRGQPIHVDSYTNRLLEANAVASIGTVGDSYDNAQAESLLGLYKTECVKHEGSWRGADDLEFATLSWVHWFNEVRLHSSLDHVPPLEYEVEHYRRTASPQQPLPGEPSLH